MILFQLFIYGTILIAVKGYRLPYNVVPEHYKIEILTYIGEPNNFNFDGKIWIETNCVTPTKNITLHSKNLTISNKNIIIKDISSEKNNPIVIEKIEEENDNDFLIIHLEKVLLEDHKYEIYIQFHGKLMDGLYGFYKSSYNDKKTKEKKWLGVTQFEAISARKAFPCFDEPAMKATFEISLGRKEGYSSISNMPLLKTEPVKEKPGWYWDRFENSVPMSTYLVAFVISDFGFKTAEPSKYNNVTFKIWARKDALNQVNFAKSVGPKCLEFYEEFFNIKYPLPKQDMIAIPDFSSGAMENWGLITYRESLLLFDSDVSSSTSQHSVASVIAHELAHQWFGNLVTMKWWTDLWLNEGFATYMAGVAVNHLFPQWNSLQEEAVINLINVFSFDSLKTSHPVSVTIGHPNEIEEIFDTISYKKGSFLLRMMSLFLGEETLKKGVSNYLNLHKYGNAEQDDLWESLTEEAHKNKVLPNDLTVKKVMDTWTLQTGYPVIEVTRDYKKKTAKIIQKRFFKDIIRPKDTSCWWVPLTYTNEQELSFNNTKPKTWLSCPNQMKTIDKLPDDKTWILFNIQVAGLYKINYDEKNWKLLIDTLQNEEFKKIPTLNRVQLIDDAADLSLTGDLKYEILFELLKYLKQEDEYLPWKSALTNLNMIRKQLKKGPYFGEFKEYMTDLLSVIYKKLGGLTLKKSENNDLNSIKHQILIASWACRFEVGNCVEEAQRLGKLWMETNGKEKNPIPKDLRSVIYCTFIKYGGEKEWNFIWDQYKKSNVATEKNTILNSLGCTRELWLLNRFLEWSTNETYGLRRQDSSSVFGSVTANEIGYYVAKDFFYKNIDRIYNLLGHNARKLGRYLSSIAGQMIFDKDYEELKIFIEKNPKYFKGLTHGVEQSLETAKLNVQWQDKHLYNVKNLLKSFTTDE